MVYSLRAHTARPTGAGTPGGGGSASDPSWYGVSGDAPRANTVTQSVRGAGAPASNDLARPRYATTQPERLGGPDNGGIDRAVSVSDDEPADVGIRLSTFCTVLHLTPTDRPNYIRAAMAGGGCTNDDLEWLFCIITS